MIGLALIQIYHTLLLSRNQFGLLNSSLRSQTNLNQFFFSQISFSTHKLLPAYQIIQLKSRDYLVYDLLMSLMTLILHMLTIST